MRRKHLRSTAERRGRLAGRVEADSDTTGVFLFLLVRRWKRTVFIYMPCLYGVNSMEMRTTVSLYFPCRNIQRFRVIIVLGTKWPCSGKVAGSFKRNHFNCCSLIVFFFLIIFSLDVIFLPKVSRWIIQGRPRIYNSSKFYFQLFKFSLCGLTKLFFFLFFSHPCSSGSF